MNTEYLSPFLDNPNVKQYLSMLAQAEGTAKYQDPYRVAFGGDAFVVAGETVESVASFGGDAVIDGRVDGGRQRKGHGRDGAGARPAPGRVSQATRRRARRARG